MNYKLPQKISLKGFSIIELIIVVFLCGAIIMVIANVPKAINLITMSQTESKVREVVAKKVEDIRITGYDNLANGTTSINDQRLNSLPGLQATTIVSDCPSEICPNGELIKKVTINISWNETNTPKTFQIVTLIAKDGLK